MTNERTHQQITIEDIAARAGVSRSTVSRVLNGEPYVREDTRQRVLKVIQEAKYTPHPAARSLVTQRTRVIGVVIPITVWMVFEDPFYFPTLLQGVAESTHSRDYAVLLWWGQSVEDSDQFYQRIVQQNRLMDGLIIASSHDEHLTNRLLAMETPFVMVERPNENIDQISYVSVDNVEAGRMATEHLIKLGRQRIATITGAMAISDASDRLLGYRKALADYKLPADPNWVEEGDFTRKAGYLGMQKLLKQNVDALFAANDLTALGAMDAIREAGLRVPEDIAVIGFDDLPSASQATPPLSTIAHPIQKKGALATDLLIDLIEGAVESPRQILLPTQLVVRESSEKPQP